MIRWIFGMLLAVPAFVGLYYISRFWEFRLWGRDEFYGLRPQGGYVGQWLRGSDFAPFELLIWAAGVFAVLSILQKIYDFFSRSGH
ncbi:MAG: hypothetical protein AAF566_03110 [Pseudomonadota bacterium]